MSEAAAGGSFLRRLTARLLAPSFPDFFFLALIGWLFLAVPDGWDRLLLDGDCGWHIRTGQWILQHGTVPYSDLFSYSKPNDAWFAWEWGADVIFAFLYNLAGLKGVVLLGGVLIAAFGVVLFRYSLWRGGNLLVAVASSMLAVGASSVHYLARPHLFTLLFVPVAIWIIDADRRRPSSRVLLLIPLTALWTNLHGGFLAVLAILGLVSAGSMAEGLWARERESGWWRPSLRYAAIGAACLAATLLNPYGWHLHAHIFQYMRADWIKDIVDEFRSPTFRSENLLQYEILLLTGMMAAAGFLSRRKVVEPLLLVFWAHQSLTSVRHATIYCAIAAPLVACELSRLWDLWADSASRKSAGRILWQMGVDARRGAGRMSAVPALAVALLAFAGVPVKWPSDFPDWQFPVAMVKRHQEVIKGSRLLTSDQWADYVIYRFWPQTKIFVDGRSDYFGEKLVRDYLTICRAGTGWQGLVERHGFTAALLPKDWPLADVLKQNPKWKLVEEGKKALFFQRVESSLPAVASLPGGHRGNFRGQD